MLKRRQVLEFGLKAIMSFEIKLERKEGRTVGKLGMKQRVENEYEYDCDDGMKNMVLHGTEFILVNLVK
jgi:hypothetical protein